MKYLTYILLGFLLALLGCNNSNPSKDTKSSDLITRIKYPITINQDEEYPAKKINIKDIATISFIPIKLPSDIIIGTATPTGCKILGDNIFIADNKNCRVIRLNSKGEFLNVIGRKGRGPEEIINLMGFSINNDIDEIFLNDLSGKIVVYSYEGKFRREVTYPGSKFMASFQPINDTCVLSLTTLKPFADVERKANNLFAFISSKNGKVIKYFGPFTAGIDNSGGGSMNRILWHGTRLTLNHPDTDTIYSYSNDTITPVYIHKYANRRFGKSLLFESTNFSLLQFSHPELENGKWNIIKKNLYIERISGKIYSAQFLLEDIFTEPYLLDGFYDCGQENTAVALMQAYKLIEYLSQNKIIKAELKTIASNLTESSSPILIILKIK